MEIRQVPIDSLIEYARNPRKNDEVVDKMVACIKEFGFRIPIVAKSDGTVVDGHLRLKAGRKLGLKEVPVVLADDLTETQIKAFRLVANQSANWAEWDEDLLKLELEDLENEGFDVDLIGFDNELSVLDKEDEEIKEDDFDTSTIDDNQPIVTKPGDLWILGEHRLLCGDATNIEDVKRLMDNQLADMVFTDPPYNVKINSIANFGQTHHDEFVMASGEMSEQEFIDFLTSVFSNLVTASKDGSIHYVCMDWKHIYEIVSAARTNYAKIKQLCVWNKGFGGMGAFYRNQHELIFVLKNGTAKHTNNFELGQFGRNRTNVWDYPGMSTGTSENIELRKLHPTVKPLRLVVDAILDCSNHGEIILDLFGGSGTTLIACEETNRKCFMMELDPKYCDVIIRRWQTMTNQTAVLEASGKSFSEICSIEDEL